jgi:hypothetical protein
VTFNQCKSGLFQLDDALFNGVKTGIFIKGIAIDSLVFKVVASGRLGRNLADHQAPPLFEYSVTFSQYSCRINKKAEGKDQKYRTRS